MSLFIFSSNEFHNITIADDENIESFFSDTESQLRVYGCYKTFSIFRSGEDSIASIGYVSFEHSDSSQYSLETILSSFHEEEIGQLKKKLIGQYILLIVKKRRLYILSDILGARNIFYSDDGKVIGSSFTELEKLIGIDSSDLDPYKVLEFLAMRHILYPALLGSGTFHKKIKWLLPHEYLVIDLQKGTFRVGTVLFSIENRKESNLSLLSRELISSLRPIICRPDFKDLPVAVSLSGGRDSRLVAALACEHYSNIRFRIAVAPGHYDSMKDMRVAQKLAAIRRTPLDIYQFQPQRDEEKFREMTEGFSPTYNNKIAAVIENIPKYSIGLGGVFGTELFMPIPWANIEDFIEARLEGAKRALKVDATFWKNFREALQDQFERLKSHFLLSDPDERAYIRLFLMQDTARYASFILAAFNRLGYQLEPYGSYAILELALRVSPELWGNHRRFGGDALVQIASMAQVNPSMARVLTYKNYRPMLPLSRTSFPLYLIGFTLQAGDWLRRKFDRDQGPSNRTETPEGYYLSDGWENLFTTRMVQKYGLAARSSPIS